MGGAEAPGRSPRGRRRPAEDGGGPGLVGGGVQGRGFSSPEVELGRGGRGGERQGPGGQVEVLEDGAGGGGAEDAGHDAPVAAAAGAGEDICPERPLQELRPGDAGRGRRPGRGGGRGTGAARCGGLERWRCARHDVVSPSRVGGKDSKVAHQVAPGGRDERGETAEEGHRRQDEVRLPGRGGPLHPVGEATIRQRREPLEGEWSARPVGAESLEAHDVVLVNPGVGVEREALHEGAPSARTALPGSLRQPPWRLHCPEPKEVLRSLRDGKAWRKALAGSRRS
jgi:hypothetical protein